MKWYIIKLYRYPFIRYSLGWALAAFLDLLLLYVFTEFFHLFYLYSSILAFCCSVSFAYFFQKYITFRNFSKDHIVQWLLFLIFQLIWQLLYMSILRIGVDKLHLYYMLVALLAKWIVFLRNYLANRHFNFKH